MIKTPFLTYFGWLSTFSIAHEIGRPPYYAVIARKRRTDFGYNALSPLFRTHAIFGIPQVYQRISSEPSLRRRQSDPLLPRQGKETRMLSPTRSCE